MSRSRWICSPGLIGAQFVNTPFQLDAAGVPDPVRLRFREKLNQAISRVVCARQTADTAVAALALSEDDARVFRPMLAEELRVLDLYNCARYRLAMEQVQEWIEAGRPQ